MELFQLRYFLKVVEHSNFTRAAESCCISQPALSQAIQKLEDELRQPLFERTGRQIALSDAGRLLLPRAQQIIRLADEARASITDDGKTGSIRVSAIPTIAPYILPEIARSFSRKLPEVQLEIQEEVTEQALKRCRAGEVDVVLLALPVVATDLDIEPLFDEELSLVLPIEHPLAQVDQVHIADLEPFPFVLLDEAHCLSGDIQSFCKRNRFQPLTTGRSNQLITVLELVSTGFGISLIPNMAMDFHQSPRRVYRSLTGDIPTRRIAMCSNSYRFQSRILKAFLEHVRETLTNRATRQAGKPAPRIN